jgi:hypothetical protein
MPASAAGSVSLQPAADGTLMLVGSGWRPGQELTISLEGDAFSALADPAGSFEVPTGLLVTGGPPLSITIRRLEESSMVFAPPGPDVPNPFAMLFAESLAMGARFFAFSALSLGAVALTARAIRARTSR